MTEIALIFGVAAIVISALFIFALTRALDHEAPPKISDNHWTRFGNKPPR